MKHENKRVFLGKTKVTTIKILTAGLIVSLRIKSIQ